MRYILVVLIIGSFALVGCNTIKGAKAGLKEDITGSKSGLKKADDWVREKMW